MSRSDDGHQRSDDPLALFARLPTLEVNDDDVAAMKRAVATLRRTEPDRQAPHRSRLWLRAAALAAVLIAALLAQGVIVPDTALPTADTAVAALLDLEAMPLVEGGDPTLRQVMQLEDGQGLSVVLLVRDGEADLSREIPDV